MDREHVLRVLRRHFPGASPQQLAEAANAIVALPDEWEEIPVVSGRRLAAGGRGARIRVFLERLDPPNGAAAAPAARAAAAARGGTGAPRRLPST
jgi:hypothetical protein